MIQSYDVVERTRIFTQTASQAELKQKGKHMCVFPIAVLIGLERLYRPLQLYPN